MPKFRTAYNRDSVEGITFNEPSMAQQHFKDECDVNNILRKYESTGLVTHVANGTPSYGDFFFRLGVPASTEYFNRSTGRF